MCFSALVKKGLEEIEFRFGIERAQEIWDTLYEKSDAFPKDYKVAGSGERFFCGDKYYAPIFIKKNNQLISEPMRYGLFFEPSLRIVHNGKRAEKRCNYNSRLDNLHSPAWKTAYNKGHGLIVLEGFFENVLVKDLLSAGNVTLEQVKHQFSKNAEDRKARILSQGKKYSPTKTEQKDPLTRNIVIQFSPRLSTNLWIPVIYNKDHWDKNPFRGFSMITSEPRPEIAAAGHDRCPVVLREAEALKWLESTGRDHREHLSLLKHQEAVEFLHALDEIS